MANGCNRMVDPAPRMVDPASELGKTGGMARAIWSGSLSFGLVNVPVGLFSATQDKTIHFNQFEAGTSDRIRYKKVNERTGREVDNAKIVKGFNLGDGEYVLLTDDELAAADPERSRNISIVDFVDAADIDPLFYRGGYYLAPQGEGSRRAYALLREAMERESKVAIADLGHAQQGVPRERQARPKGGCAHPPDHVLRRRGAIAGEELPNLPDAETFSERELSIASQLIDAMTAPFQADQYHDTHRERVEELVESKHEGREIVLEAPPPAPKVVDLMAALEASVKAAGGSPEKTTRSTAKKATGRSKTPAKSAAKSTEPARRARKKAS